MQLMVLWPQPLHTKTAELLSRPHEQHTHPDADEEGSAGRGVWSAGIRIASRLGLNGCTSSILILGGGGRVLIFIFFVLIPGQA
jgi:hypothetical protein